MNNIENIEREIQKEENNIKELKTFKDIQRGPGGIISWSIILTINFRVANSNKNILYFNNLYILR